MNRLTATGIGLFLAVSFAFPDPARAATGDSSGGSDTLPPPGTFLAAFVMDSSTGLPLAGASVTIQNYEANISVATTDARGWVYVPSSGLPYPSAIATRYVWVTAGKSGYLSRLITLSACGSDLPAPCSLRYALARATDKNSFAFAGTLLDSARHPIAHLPIDVSSASGGGWITFLSTTDDNGNFVFKDLPQELDAGYLFVRNTPSTFQMLPVQWSRSGDSIAVPRWSTTSLAPSRGRARVSARGESAPAFLFRFRNRDAAGRRRD